jgi:hypothetical protein
MPKAIVAGILAAFALSGTGALGCRQLIGIDDDRSILGDAASTDDTEGGAADGPTGPSTDGGLGKPDGGTESGLETGTGADASGGLEAGSEFDAEALCQTSGTADRRFPQWSLPPVDPPLSNYDVTTDAVLDLTTGLVWERNPPTTSLDWPGTQAYCGTLATGGFADWRVPTRIEVLSIADYSQLVQSGQLLNPSVFGSIMLFTDGIWTSSMYLVTASDSDQFVVNLTNSSTPVVSTIDTPATLYERCVRGGCVAKATSRFVISSGAALDAFTGLTWQQAMSPGGMDWSDAATYCTTLTAGGKASGWRVPDIRELASIFDESQEALPLWDPIAFMSGPATELWSSTAVGGGGGMVFTLDFADQTNNYILQEMGCFGCFQPSLPVRCVHDP